MKNLLSLTLALCSLTASAQEVFQTAPAVLTSVSEDGNWASGSTQGIGYLLNFKTENLTTFSSSTDKYDMKTVANSGLVGGTLNPSQGSPYACYVTEEGGYMALPVKEDITSSSCCGGPNDGSFLAGNIAKPQTGYDLNSMQCPVVWYRDADGKFETYEELPFDPMGFDNRRIQEAYILGVSGDGLTLYGRIIYAAGDVYQPVVWKRSSVTSRDWVCKKLCQSVMFNTDKEAPKWPSYRPEEPDVTKYYTAEELANYEEALKKYQDSVALASWTIPADQRGPYPTYNPEEHKADFFDVSTADGVKRHNDYAAEYNKFISEATAYNDSITLYWTRYEEYVKRPVFHIRNLSSSANGKYLVTNMVDFDSGTMTVCVNVNTDETTVLDGVDGYFPTAVLNDGTIFLGEPAVMPPLNRHALVYKDGTTMDFAEWVKTKSQKAYEDLTTNFETSDGITYLGIVNSQSPDGTTFGGFNQGLDFAYTGWVMNLAAYDDYTSGVKTAKEDATAEVKSVTYTDASGRRTSTPARGLYIKTVKLSDGTVKSTKVVRP